MTTTATSFRLDFPEFSNVTDYPDTQVNFWLGIAGLALNPCIWGNMLGLGTELYVAHNLSMEFMAGKEAANGAQPGVTTGPVQMKIIDKVQIQFDSQNAIVKDAGAWNNTIYGTRFITLAKLRGSVPIQVGIGYGYIDPLGSQNAWSGPYTGPTMSG